jgi:Ser/Thr protein kinase RdoA (MazF antagonist)
MSLTTIEDFENYIKSCPEVLGLDPTIKYELQELTGGTANFVFRVTHENRKTTIIKHAEPFIRTNPDFKFPQLRMDFEARVLSEVPSVLVQDDIVQPISLLGYDSKEHILHISDGGSKTLKDAYSDPGFDALVNGCKLGSWLAKFHIATKTIDIGDNQIAKTIYRFSYNNLADSLEKYGQGHDLGENVNAEYGSLLQTDDVCVCHGDFWPGNVIVKGELGHESVILSIVDWEMTRRGNGATDVGQFAAESWLLDRFQGGKGLLKAFLKAYAAEIGTEFSFEDSLRVAIHFGTHLSFWPTRVHWGNDEETAECVQFGSEFLRRARSKDEKWLKMSVLEELFVNCK